MDEKNGKEVLLEKRFKSRVHSETSFGVQEDYGEQDNVMRLMQGQKNLYIEWIVGPEDDPVAEAEIGISTVGKKVTDYDGVFELPKEALELLREYGLNTSEVEA